MRAVIVAMALAPSLGWSQSDSPRPYWYGRIGPSFGQPVLGSEDTRRGTLYGIGYSRPEPRITLKGLHGELAYEAYYLFTKGGGFEDIPVNEMRSFGLEAIARYRTHWVRGWDTHFDLGWGFVYNSISTRDLDSRLNSTPSIGLGVTQGRWDFTVRWYHQSNAGTDGNNQGTNQIQYLLSFRF